MVCEEHEKILGRFSLVRLDLHRITSNMEYTTYTLTTLGATSLCLWRYMTPLLSLIRPVSTETEQDLQLTPTMWSGLQSIMVMFFFFGGRGAHGHGVT